MSQSPFNQAPDPDRSLPHPDQSNLATQIRLCDMVAEGVLDGTLTGVVMLTVGPGSPLQVIWCGVDVLQVVGMLQVAGVQVMQGAQQGRSPGPSRGPSSGPAIEPV